MRAAVPLAVPVPNPPHPAPFLLMQAVAAVCTSARVAHGHDAVGANNVSSTPMLCAAVGPGCVSRLPQSCMFRLPRCTGWLPSSSFPMPPPLLRLVTVHPSGGLRGLVLALNLPKVALTFRCRFVCGRGLTALAGRRKSSTASKHSDGGSALMALSALGGLAVGTYSNFLSSAAKSRSNTLTLALTRPSGPLGPGLRPVIVVTTRFAAAVGGEAVCTAADSGLGICSCSSFLACSWSCKSHKT